MGSSPRESTAHNYIKTYFATSLVMIGSITDYIFPKNLIDQLQDVKFIALEVRGQTDIPDINVYFPAAMLDREQFLESNILQRLRRIIQSLQIPHDFSKSGLIVVDPTNTSYKDSIAFFHTRTNAVWVKAHSWWSFDHEAAHWLTGVFTDQDGLHSRHLVNEGLASWTAWAVKTPEEQHVDNPIENYSMNARNFWRHGLNRNEIHLDMEIETFPAMSLGGVLWQIISEKVGNNSLLMQHWRNIDQFSSIRDWIISMGLDPGDVEEEWRRQIFDIN